MTVLSVLEAERWEEAVHDHEGAWIAKGLQHSCTELFLRAVLSVDHMTAAAECRGDVVQHVQVHAHAVLGDQRGIDDHPKARVTQKVLLYNQQKEKIFLSIKQD